MPVMPQREIERVVCKDQMIQTADPSQVSLAIYDETKPVQFTSVKAMSFLFDVNEQKQMQSHGELNEDICDNKAKRKGTRWISSVKRFASKFTCQARKNNNFD